MTDPNATPPPYGESTPPSHGQPTPPPAGGPTPPPATGPANYGRQYGQQYGQQPHLPPAGHQSPARPGGITGDEQVWGSAAHWSSFVAAAVALAFLGPLIVMLTKGNESPWVRRNAVESLNFQLSILLYLIVSGVLIIAVIGFVLLPIVGLTWLVCTIIASVKAARGEEYHYPVTIRLVH
jgi:uncharacterized Tic20 family protein